jgi:hypothetical protein
MELKFNFVADSVVKGRIYPALSRHHARPYTTLWREFGQHWPYTIPVRLQEYCDRHGVPIGLYKPTDVLPLNTYYPVGLAFFDFEIDYFELIDTVLRVRLQKGELRVLFYYHEGDNPACIKARLDQLACNHSMPGDCYIFVSANSAADHLPGFVSFDDFELWFFQRNLSVTPLAAHAAPRPKDFTALVRLHKWWRATAMSHLHQQRILDNSYWSYCEAAAGADTDSPIEVDSFDQLRIHRDQFLKTVPWTSDEMSQAERNNHSVIDPKYFTNSYCNIVLETHFDADQSGGVFLTEKTFKPIKHGQMFFVAGCAGSLQRLRDLGYCVFDSVLDNSYDLETNSTDRWRKLVAAIKQAQPNLAQLNQTALPDIMHNQKLFTASKHTRLNTLIQNINAQYN